jgi:hypothetical protein
LAEGIELQRIVRLRAFAAGVSLGFLAVLPACGGDSGPPSLPQPPAGFTLSAGLAGPVPAGTNTSLTLTVAPVNGFSGTVAVDLGGAPSGTTFQPPLPVSVPAGGAQTVTLSIPSTALPQTYPLTIRGTNGALSREAAATLVVTPARAFTLDVSPISVNLRPGTTASVAVTVNPTGDFSDSTVVSLDSLPAGVVVSSAPNVKVFAGGVARFTVSASASAAVVTQLAVVRGVAGSVARSALVPVGVVPAIWTYRIGNKLVIDRVEGGDSVQLVTDLSKGGIVSEATLNKMNYLDTPDLSRGAQVNLFTGDFPYDDCRGCANPPVYNPAQGGDMHNHPSAVLASSISASGAAVTVRALDWWPDNKRTTAPNEPVASDVTIEQTVTAVSGERRAFKLHYKISHTGPDLHPATAQWVPVLFARQDFNQLVRYTGTSPWTNGATTTLTPSAGVPTTTYFAGEQWAAWANNTNDGIALYVPGDYGNFRVKSETGTPGAQGTGYNRMAPNAYFALPPGATVEVDAYLVLGNVSASRATISRLHTGGGASDPFDPVVHTDAPTDLATVTGSTIVRGWAVDNRQVARVDVLIDGTAVGTATYGAERPDLASAFPGVNTNAGFSYTLNTTPLTDGLHELTVRATDGAGNATTDFTRRLSIANVSPNLPPNVSVTVGAEEVVYPYSTLCPAGSGDIYDFPARFTRAVDNSIIMTSLNGPTNYFSFGPTIDQAKRDCTPALRSPQSPRPDNFDNWYWINAIYREGNTIHALVHNEYHDPVSALCKPGDSGPGNPCSYWSIVYAASNDGGRTYQTPPNNVVAAPSAQWDPSSSGFYGAIQPTNIIHALDGYYYFAFPHVPNPYVLGYSGVCLARTKTLGDPSSWRMWDGSGFTAQLRNPYLSAAGQCAFLNFGATRGGGEVNHLSYNSYLQSYIIIGAQPWSPVCGITFALSKDLIHWTPLQVLKKESLTQPGCRADPSGKIGSAAYETLVDPTDTSVNFEVTGQRPYLYLIRWRSSSNESMRDIVRLPLTFNIVP